MKNMIAKPIRSLAQRDMVVDSWFMVLLKLINLKSCGIIKMVVFWGNNNNNNKIILACQMLRRHHTFTHERKTMTAARLLKWTWRRASGSKLGYVLWFSSRKWSLWLTADVLQMFIMMAGTLSWRRWTKVSYSNAQNTVSRENYTLPASKIRGLL